MVRHLPKVTQIIRGRVEVEPMDFESSKLPKEKN